MFKQGRIPTACTLIVFAVLLAVRVAGIVTRTQLHPDETFSVMLAQANQAK